MGDTRILNSVFSLHDLVVLGIVESYANLPSYRAAPLCRLWNPLTFITRGVPSEVLEKHEASIFPTSQPSQPRSRSLMTVSTDTSNTVPGALRKRKAHTKSRRGCSSCKTRRVKCDESKPGCQQCKGMSLGNVTTISTQICLLPHFRRVRRVLRVWWQGRWLDIHGRELLRSKRTICIAFRALKHNGRCGGRGQFEFVELPTTKPILYDGCTLQWAC